MQLDVPRTSLASRTNRQGTERWDLVHSHYQPWRTRLRRPEDTKDRKPRQSTTICQKQSGMHRTRRSPITLERFGATGDGPFQPITRPKRDLTRILLGRGQAL